MFPLIGGLLSAGGGILGSLFGGGDKTAANNDMASALDQFKQLSPQQQQVLYSQYQQAGVLNPQLEQTFQQDPTAMAGIQTDPANKAAAMQALSSLQNISAHGGMNDTDQANMNKMLSQTSQQEAGARNAILQQMAQKGKSGSGFDLASQLLNQQQSANRANDQQTQLAGTAQQRALQALSSAGTLGQNLNQQDFTQQSQIAQAKDLVNKFNTQNQQAVAGTNTSTANQAQQYNLNNAQAIANKNTDTQNKQQDQNNSLYQQYYNNLNNKATETAGQYNKDAGFHTTNANDTARTWSDAGQGAGEVIGAASAPKANQQFTGLSDASKTPSPDDEAKNKWPGYNQQQ